MLSITIIPSALQKTTWRQKGASICFVGGAIWFSPLEDVTFAWYCASIYSCRVQLHKNYNHVLNPIHMNYKINKGHFCYFLCSCVEQVSRISYFVSVNTLAPWSLRSLLCLHVYVLVAHCSPTKVTSVDWYATPETDLGTIEKLMFRRPSAKEGTQQVWFLILWGLGLFHIISRSIGRSIFWMV